MNLITDKNHLFDNLQSNGNKGVGNIVYQLGSNLRKILPVHWSELMSDKYEYKPHSLTIPKRMYIFIMNKKNEAGNP